jgi:hypothetical protein
MRSAEGRKAGACDPFFFKVEDNGEFFTVLVMYILSGEEFCHNWTVTHGVAWVAVSGRRVG